MHCDAGILFLNSVFCVNIFLTIVHACLVPEMLVSLCMYI